MTPAFFLSCNREDQAAARRFADGFEAQGFSVWWDVTLRSNVPDQLAFSRGIHACAGASLAPVEARITLERLFERTSDVRIDESRHGAPGARRYEQVRMLQIGIPADTDERDVVDAGYGVSELLFFDNVQDQRTYQDHPVHQKFIREYSMLWEKVVVYDAMGIQPAKSPATGRSRRRPASAPNGVDVQQ